MGCTVSAFRAALQGGDWERDTGHECASSDASLLKAYIVISARILQLSCLTTLNNLVRQSADVRNADLFFYKRVSHYCAGRY